MKTPQRRRRCQFILTLNINLLYFTLIDYCIILYALPVTIHYWIVHWHDIISVQIYRISSLVHWHDIIPVQIYRISSLYSSHNTSTIYIHTDHTSGLPYINDYSGEVSHTRTTPSKINNEQNNIIPVPVQISRIRSLYSSHTSIIH